MSLGKFQGTVPAIPVPDHTALRAVEPAFDGQSFLTLGSTSIGVGPSTNYFYDASDTTSVDDDDLVIVSTGGARYKKVQSSVAADGVSETNYGDVQLAIDSLLSDKANALVHNLNAAVDPTASDDLDAGYTQGSLWYNTTDVKLYICFDNSDEAAVWVLLTPDLDTTGLSVNDLVSYDGEKLIKSVDGCRTGFFDYNDSATAGTPISVTGGAGYVTLTNDELGAFTNKTFAPQGVTDVWDALNNRFDWSDLKLGDQIEIRVDVEVTTTVANQEVDLAIELGNGGSPYDLLFQRSQYKTAGAQPIVRWVGLYLGDANTLNNYALLKIKSPSNCTVVVHGWYVKVDIRG